MASANAEKVPVKAASSAKSYESPKGAKKKANWKNSKGNTVPYEVKTEWMVLRKKDQPAAEMFYTYYKSLNSKKVRPITFVFNGGPGAASAYLHIGGLGPLRVRFESDGNIPPPPANLVNNEDSWLEFTDLVFIDPIGTGFSQIIEPSETSADSKEKKDPKKTVEEKEFYQINRDLESIGEFIERFLSQNKLWAAPVYVAGESYGGYRTAKLARRLQEKHGIGVHAVIAISPALEWSLLNPHDYDLLSFVDTFCTMALAAAFHGKSRVFDKKKSIEMMKKQIETFATGNFASALVGGNQMSESVKNETFILAADYLGIGKNLMLNAQGRIRFWTFARELLKDSRKVVGFYDATITAIDPFPDREMHQAPDPTLTSIERIFTGGINQLLRSHVKLETDRRYQLLSDEVNTSWKRDEQSHVFDMVVGATDDLRFAMSMNPHMKVLICHGYYDMVTPYFSTDRLVSQMRLLPEQIKKIEVQHFGGGHMFYTWDKSRRDFSNWINKAFKP